MQNKRSTPEERRENAIKAGVASGQARRQRRLLRETLSGLLRTPLDDAAAAAALEAAGLPADLQGGMIYAVLRRAQTGDVEAARYIRDTLGEKPTETFNLSVQKKPIRSMDLSQLSDEELERMAARCHDSGAPELSMQDIAGRTNAELSVLLENTDR